MPRCCWQLPGCAAGGSSKQQDFQPSLDTEKEVQFSVIGFFENFEALDQVMNDFSAYYPNATFVYQRVRDNDEVAYLEANTDVDLFMTSGDLLHRQGAPLCPNTVLTCRRRTST